ncbi:MAG: glycosyltransferase [Acidimicrobiia bacterium]
MRNALRILIATWDGAGNVPPIRTLAGALAARGDDVHVLGHESTRESFEDTGSTFIGWASSSQPPFIREFVPEDLESAYAEEHIFFGKSYQSDLRPVIEQLRPDVVMVDVNLRYGILEGLRVDQPLIVLCHILYGIAVRYDDTVTPYFPELAQAALRDGVPEFASRRAMMDLADRVLVFSYAGFDPLSGTDAGKSVVHVGPLRVAGEKPSGWERLVPDRELVLIALSTSDQNQGATLQRLCDACAQLEIEAVITTGPMVAPEDLDTSENVTAIDFVNHDHILPETDLLITHAGHGTVVAGLTYGVPMMCMPFGRDQDFNADRVAELGLGTVVNPNSQTDVLSRLIRDMLDDDALRHRARQFRDSLQTHPRIREALAVIDHAVDSSQQGR